MCDEDIWWEGPVSFDIAITYDWRCEEGVIGTRGQGVPRTEYGLAMKPACISWDEIGIVSVLTIYSEELDELMRLIAEHLDSPEGVPQTKKQHRHRPNVESDEITFTLEPNGRRCGYGEFSLRVVGRDLDGLLLVDRENLKSLVKRVTRLREEEKQSVN